MRKSPPRRSLMKSTLVSAACMSAACASAPAPRPVLPTECPPGSEETLRRFGIDLNDFHRAALLPTDEIVRDKLSTIAVQEGPRTVFILTRWGELPSYSQLQGVLYIEKGRLHGRFTRLLPLGTNEDLPVCMQLIEQGRMGQRFEPESRPDKPLVDVFSEVRTMSSFR